jgi:acetylornithine deacetylase
VIVHGRAAHGSAPGNGIDAIVHMAEVVRGLADLYHTFEAAPDRLNGITVLHTGTIKGGTDYATYPSQCVLGIEIGTQPGEKLANRVADIERVFEDVRRRYAEFRGEVRVNIERDPFKAVGHEGLVAAAAKATRQVAGRGLTEVGLNAWTDAALMQDAGIPTILLGAEGGNFHTSDEWVSLPECVQMVEIVRQTAMQVCA